MPKQSLHFLLGNPLNGRNSAVLKKDFCNIPGVISANLNQNYNSFDVDYDSGGVDPNTLENHLTQLGYKINLTTLENKKYY